MSNRTYLDLSKCESRKGEITWRFTFQDDYGVYTDTLPVDSFIDPKELLKLVIENVNEYENESALTILDHLKEFEKGIIIDDEYFDYEQIKDIIEDDDN